MVWIVLCLAAPVAASHASRSISRRTRRRLRSSRATSSHSSGGAEMRINRVAAAGALLAGALAAAPAQAQVNYYTQGFFTSAFPGCGTAVTPTPTPGAPISAACTGGGFTLTYHAKDLNPGLIGSGSVVSLGNFALTGTGDVTVPSGAVMFTLAIQQTNPTTGTGMTVGSFSGSVRTSPDFSSLIWTPAP